MCRILAATTTTASARWLDDSIIGMSIHTFIYFSSGNFIPRNISSFQVSAAYCGALPGVVRGKLDPAKALRYE